MQQSVNNSAGARLGRIPLLTLLAVLAVAAAVRLPALNYVPPGLNQDEAPEAWNAQCLLKTGHDQDGKPWPIFYTKGLGANRSVLYIYCLMPFQAVFGMSPAVTRLPNALAGVATVFLLFWIARHWFGVYEGLAAAALLALNPWHIQLSRFGHQAGFCPFLVALAVAAMIWARLPMTDRDRSPTWLRAALAGIVVGIACYGYLAIRLFLPPLVLGMVLVNGRHWWRLLRQRATVIPAVLFALGVGGVVGPLIIYHVMPQAEIGKRAASLWLWQPGTPVPQIIWLVLKRYAAHFGPDFLFLHGDHYELQSARDFGQFHWYALPFMLTGIVVLAIRARRSVAARLLLCWFLLYPLGDMLHHHQVMAADGTRVSSLHALRSAPGLDGPLLVTAVGLAWLGRRLATRSRPTKLAVSGIMAFAVVGLNARFLTYYFGPYRARPAVYHGFQTDLVDACEWLKPRLKDVDAVFCTTARMNIPYIVALVALDYTPSDWFAGTREHLPTNSVWEQYRRVGKLYFLYDRASFEQFSALQQDDKPERVIVIMRPGEGRFGVPVHEIRRPDGSVALQIYDLRI